MKKIYLSFLLVVFLLSMQADAALAQTYRFQLLKNEANLTINSDGNAVIEYTLDFQNDTGVSAIDFVDIGMPNNAYDLKSVKAEVDGSTITDIQNSEYVKPGIALGLGSKAIKPGAKGTVHVLIGTVPNMIYPASSEGEKDYASIQFSPTWFGSEYVHGSTNLIMTLFLPPGMKKEEPRYYEPKNWPGTAEPESAFDDQGGVYYRWKSEKANGSTKYIFGAGFPKRLVPVSAIVTKPTASPTSSSGGGFTWDDFEGIIGSLCCVGSVGFFLINMILGIYKGLFGDRKRKLQYLSPKISVEGHGIKRGLTAVEVAVLMEQPLDKVLTMILFATLKKEAAKVVQKEPLKLEVAETLPADLQAYEVAFLNAFKSTDDVARRKALQQMMIDMVQAISAKMKGFSRKETIDYYKDISTKAWQMVEQADTPEVKSQIYEESMDWAILDGDFNRRTTDVFHTGPVFLPTWWWRYDPSYGHGSLGAPSGGSFQPSSSSGGSSSMPTLPGSDFAASVVNGVSTFAAGAVGDVAAFTGGITNKTNPIPVTRTTRGSGGGGCACACACAGCACACAGGGR